MKKLLLTDSDLKDILKMTQDELLELVSQGMPHYYCNDKFYFNYAEVQEWISETMELGYIETQYQSLTDYLNAILREEIDYSNIRKQLKEYMKKHRGLADDRLVWLYNNCAGKKYDLFCQYIYTCFPRIKQKNIYKYYFALLKTLLDTNIYRDSLNIHNPLEDYI